MDENRVNHTDPVVQVRLRVMVGNFHGIPKKVRLAAGFVYPDAELLKQIRGGHMQNQQTRKWTFSRVVAVIGVILLLMATSFMAYNAVDEQARVSTFR